MSYRSSPRDEITELNRMIDELRIEVRRLRAALREIMGLTDISEAAYEIGRRALAGKKGG